jgi:hypothetical protein
VSLLSLCQWLQDTPWGTAIRESVWVFPIIETTHVLALSISVGTIAIVDLRLFGVILKKEPASEISNQVLPWSIAGFVVMFLTGALLFWCQAVKAYNSPFFRIKLICLFLAGLNALIFQVTVNKTMATWDRDLVPPARARLAGLASLVLWTGVIAAGRTMAYKF